MVTDSNTPERPDSSDRLNDFLRQVVATFRDEHRSDVELLACFVKDGDQEAFRAIVGRYGRSVWAACLAVLGDPHDAEDAFQAAFVALARRAHTVDARRGIGRWVRSAARNAARKVRRGANRLNRLRERVAAEKTPEGRPADESHTWVLAAEELERLPRHLREALVMYHLEGRTLSQIAESLGCSVTEAHRRVTRGLEKLRTRLSARGVALTTGLLAAIPAGLMTSTANAATAFAQGLPLLSPRVAALTDAILAPRFPSWWLAAGVTILLAASTAVALVAYPVSNPPQAAANAEPDPKPPVEVVATDKPAKVAGRPTADLTGRVTDAQGEPVAGASVSALVRRPWAPGDRGLRDDVVAKVTTDADGRYALTVPADFATHYPERSVTLLVSGVGLPTTTKLVRLGTGDADVGVPATRTVSGVCVGSDGRSVPGVKLGVVRLGNAAVEPVQGREQNLPEGWPADVVSGKDGIFAIAGLPAGEDVWVEVRDDRFALTTVRFAACESKLIRIALAEPRVIEGRVTASDTGKPVADVKVSVYAGDWDDHSHRHTSVTSIATSAVDAPPVEFDCVSGSDGRFRLRLPSTTGYRVCFHPPAGIAYVGVYRMVEWKISSACYTVDVALPVGQLIRGVMREEDGTPVVGGWVWCDSKAGNPQVAPDMLISRHNTTQTATDGSFVLAMPSGPCVVRGYGPTSNYRLARDTPSHSLGHAYVKLDEDDAPAKSVILNLRRGVTVPIRVLGPDGSPVKGALAFSRSVIQPLRDQVPRPLSVRNGAFGLPGCDPDRIYGVVVLDTVNGRGGATEIRPGNDGVVRLEQLGSASMCLTDPAGKSISGARVTLGVNLLDDRPVGAEKPAKADTICYPQSWIDSSQMASGVTGSDGRVEFRNLIPSVNYIALFHLGGRSQKSTLFRVTPGQTVRLPDVVMTLRKPSKSKTPLEPHFEED